MRVLAVDPGLTRCGVGVVDQDGRRRLALAGVGVARSSAEAPVAERLLSLEREIEQWLDACAPDAVALEQVFSQHNVRTVMGTAQLSGVVLTAAARRGIPVTHYTPSEVKAAVTGSGRASKQQVAAMVMRLLRLAEAPKPADAADAVALAICHQWRGAAHSRLASARANVATPMGGRP